MGENPGMISPIPYQTSMDALLRPAEGAAFFVGWEPVDLENLDLLGAELSRLAYADEPVVREALKGIGFELQLFVGGDDFEGRVALGGTDAFLARHADRRLTVLAFRGTESDKPEDILADAMTLQVSSALFPDCRVHAGFADRFERVAKFLPSSPAPAGDRFLITGHSLGAALATLAAARWQPTLLLTYGGPRVGDRGFSRLLEGVACRRFVGCCDIVTRMPPERFDEPELRVLLEELGGMEVRSPVLAKILDVGGDISARVLSLFFRAADPGMEFVHVGSPIFIRSDGTRRERESAESIQAEQRAAREAYRGLIARRRRIMVPTTGEAPRSDPGEPPSSGGVGDLLRRLLPPVASGIIPTRDLADHAPLNYVSAFTGRVS